MAKKTNKDEQKTNVMRLLDQAKIPYQAFCYVDTDAISGTEVASVLGQNPDMVFKTLVTVGKTGTHYVFVIPVNCELNLKKAAKVAGDKNMELVPVKELLALTGYIRGGCSPVGMKKRYPTFFDETALLWDEIAVSAGERGHQMVVPTEALVEFVSAEFVDIIL